MLEVTEKNLIDFRAEILLSANLRHPNIVVFIGACWGRSAVCLVLEYVSRGSLEDLLASKSPDIKWHDPLIKLATDIARGSTFLQKQTISFAAKNPIISVFDVIVLLLSFFWCAVPGMDYLHERRLFDDAAKRYSSCILHRDLKPANGD